MLYLLHIWIFTTDIRRHGWKDTSFFKGSCLHAVVTLPVCWGGTSAPGQHTSGREGDTAEMHATAGSEQHFTHLPLSVQDTRGVAGAVQGMGNWHRGWWSLHLALAGDLAVSATACTFRFADFVCCSEMEAAWHGCAYVFFPITLYPKSFGSQHCHNMNYFHTVWSMLS